MSTQLGEQSSKSLRNLACTDQPKIQHYSILIFDTPLLLYCDNFAIMPSSKSQKPIMLMHSPPHAFHTHTPITIQRLVPPNTPIIMRLPANFSHPLSFFFLPIALPVASSSLAEALFCQHHISSEARDQKGLSLLP